MCLLNMTRPIMVTTLLGVSSALGITHQDDLLIRWAFDEGNGSIVADSVSNSTPLF